uniref:Uncharacterized protein n=1 Tax=Lepeophtheirus salmonis TaxID=72036 RepID=A0A0K2V157_LEPSM
MHKNFPLQLLALHQRYLRPGIVLKNTIHKNYRFCFIAIFKQSSPSQWRLELSGRKHYSNVAVAQH